MAKAQRQSRMTVQCPFTLTETNVRWQETDVLVGLGRGVFKYCEDCEMKHYHIVQ